MLSTNTEEIMYAPLKNLLRSKGYHVTEGDEWTPVDTREFTTFAKFELGVSNGHRIISHPGAHLEAVAKIQSMVEAHHGLSAARQAEPVAVSAPVVEPEPAAPVVPEPVAAPVDEPQAFDLSAQGQTEKQVLEESTPEAAEAPAEEPTVETAVEEPVGEPPVEDAAETAVEEVAEAPAAEEGAAEEQAE
jgi:hypothetical protein